jgi:hypothetical protein
MGWLKAAPMPPALICGDTRWMTDDEAYGLGFPYSALMPTARISLPQR